MHSFVIGICGGSGAGKTTISIVLRSAFVVGAVSILNEDNYYKSFNDMNPAELGQVDWDNPNSKDLPRLARDLVLLKTGQKVSNRLYDFAMHRAGEIFASVAPAPIIVVEGLHFFSYQPIRSLLDLTVFIEAREEIRLRRRLLRDVNERGRTTEAAKQQWVDAVEPANRVYVEPFRAMADMVLNNSDKVPLDTLVQPLVVAIAQRANAEPLLKKQ